MPVRGSLTKEQLGFSMPPYAPLFPKPPYFYSNATLMIFKYVTDVSAARMVPDMVELADPPTAGLVFASYPSSNLGPYDEVVLFLDVVFKGRPLQFGAFLYVTTDAAMAAGREMGGYPKKIARIEFLSGPDRTAVMERPSGLRICTGTMRPEVRQISSPDPQKTAGPPAPLVLNYLTLRLFPSPQRNQPPTLVELLETHWTINCSEVWTGPGSCQLSGASELDPLHWAPVLQPIVCELVKGDIRVDLDDQPSETPL
ncbi:MAG: acetoacetate decarboxylase family protein [Isosphaeraceae bacterium]